jgi:catechol 2,3-dioxygenase-like lactoylglutathione lyase family enzyme
VPLTLGTVGHFGITVPDPNSSARWWIRVMNLRKRFSFPGGVVVGNDAVDIVLRKGAPRPDVIDHVSFHLDSMRELRAALAELRRKNVDLEDPGDEIGSEGGNSPNMGLWFRDPDGYRWELSVLARQRRPRRKKRT